ncbi:hypothetical protein OG894_11020 [Streptomyces sp. NBC_01724]|uniref:hypothetical protein n=1 Tax=Streptomyces TaxID=1883 RepID=UPI0028C38D69|nr:MULTISPECIES: hypothetical protein [unclassified Streptomyces]WTE54871.1 hypothetical protein OG987_31445 [Streptomyces sp. NBC_01620]WTE62946.1 hypothetical protein OG784_31295 [Streptomyces sp. NBC_01617]WTI90297.1 hypothetical protein OHB17_30985 [Streptomyces sp. NBC_00724]WNO67899.1 hypothetical protein RPQ02_30805 [Streptomyces sp. AM2-3-1]WSC72566.1 hypothetical protein OG807_31030 [Streptomyces sp. NBC_01760]
MVLTPRLSPSFAPRNPAQSVEQSAQPTHPSAVEANEAIRALVDARAGQDWSSVESAAYEVLLIEWAAATRGAAGDIIEAA